jgi:hypothetical protein
MRQGTPTSDGSVRTGKRSEERALAHGVATLRSVAAKGSFVGVRLDGCIVPVPADETDGTSLSLREAVSRTVARAVDAEDGDIRVVRAERRDGDWAEATVHVAPDLVPAVDAYLARAWEDRAEAHCDQPASAGYGQ